MINRGRSCTFSGILFPRVLLIIPHLILVNISLPGKLAKEGKYTGKNKGERGIIKLATQPDGDLNDE